MTFTLKATSPIEWLPPALGSKKNRKEIKRAAKELGDYDVDVTPDQLARCLRAGHLETLSDEDWDNLVNSQSRDVKRIKDVLEAAHAVGKKVHTKLEEYVAGKVTAPIIVCFQEDPDLYLVVNGETRLMLATIFADQIGKPKVWTADLPDRLKAKAWQDQPRDDIGRWTTEGGQTVGEGKVPSDATGNINPDAAKYPHLAHMMNGQRVHSTGRSRQDALRVAGALRDQGVYASILQDPKQPRGRQFMVMIPANATQKAFDPQQPRAADGTWTDGADAADMPGSNQHKIQMDAASRTWSERAREIPAALYEKAKEKVKAKYQALEERYGRPAALAIMGAGIVGTAIPLPGTTFLAAAPVVAAAEVYRYFRRDKTKADIVPPQTFTDEQLKTLGRSFFDELTADWAGVLGEAGYTQATCSRCGAILQSNGDDTWCPNCRKEKALTAEPFREGGEGAAEAAEWGTDCRSVDADFPEAMPGSPELPGEPAEPEGRLP